MLWAEMRSGITDSGAPRWQRLLLWTRYCAVVVAISAAYFAAMMMLAICTLGAVAIVLAVSALFWLLPPAWRPTWREPPVPEPTGPADCPSCGAPLVVDSAVEHLRRGVCSGCGQRAVRVYRSMSYGRYWSQWTVGVNQLPAVKSIRSIHARYFDYDLLREVEFDVPREHWQPVLSALRPAWRDSDPSKWKELGELSITLTDGRPVRVNLYDLSDKEGAFSTSPDHYYRGGTTSKLAAALKGAWKDSGGKTE